MSEWTSEELRRAALAALGACGDERARDALRRAEIAIAPGVVTWEASAGRVEGHRVTLGVDGACLGGLRAAPAVVDALQSAVASAIASRRGEALHELEVGWARGVAVADAEGYRGRPPGRQTLHEALVGYLNASGQAALARVVEAAAVVPGASGVRVTLPERARAELRALPGGLAALAGALRELVAPDAHVAVEP